MRANASLLTLLARLWRHLSRRRRRQLWLLLVLVLASAFADVVTLGAVLPFLGVLTAPERVFGYPLIADAAQALGISSAPELVLPVTLAFSAVALTAGGIRLLTTWVSARLSYAAGTDLSLEVYRRTLYQPYQVHVSRNSSEVISGIVNKVGGSINVLYQLLMFISSAVLLFAVVLALLAIDAVVASAA